MFIGSPTFEQFDYFLSDLGNGFGFTKNLG